MILTKGYIEFFLSNSKFRRLWAASVISLLGEWFNTIALFFLILEFDFLNSPHEIQKKVEQYFIKDEFSSIDISKLKIAEIKNNKIEFNIFFTKD